MQDAVVRLLARRAGHFALESGHHGDLWLELERLFLHPEAVRVPLEALARLPNEIWEPAACPLCARGVPLET